MKIKLKKIEQGVCPYCGDSDIDYSPMELADEYVSYRATCQACGHEFEEWYKLEFAGHNVGKNCTIMTNAGDENVEIEMGD